MTRKALTLALKKPIQQFDHHHHHKIVNYGRTYSMTIPLIINQHNSEVRVRKRGTFMVILGH